jgi:hypothetical protein
MEDVVATIVAFLRGIGIEVRTAELAGGTFLPGLAIDHGTLVYDPQRLAHPGDLLHEAGHIAFAPPATRASLTGHATSDLGEELAAIAWSWAALVHLRLDPELLFHAGGYQGSARAFIDNFREGRFVGVPMLEWAGMAEEKNRRRDPPVAYPRMLKWLRE